MTEQEIGYIKILIREVAKKHDGKFMLWWLSPRKLDQIYGEVVNGNQKRYRVNKVLNIMADSGEAKKAKLAQGCGGWVWNIC